MTVNDNKIRDKLRQFYNNEFDWGFGISAKLNNDVRDLIIDDEVGNIFSGTLLAGMDVKEMIQTIQYVLDLNGWT